MRHLKSFETKITYKEQDREFNFKINDPVKILKDDLDGLSKKLYFIQNRSKKTQNYYLLYDINGYTLNWVTEENIRLATKQEVENARLAHTASKYNI